MIVPFIAHPPTDGVHPDVHRQFTELQTVLQQMLEKLDELEQRIAALEP